MKITVKDKKRFIGQAIVVVSLGFLISYPKHLWSLLFLLSLFGGIDLMVIAGKDEVINAFRKNPQGFAEAVKRQDDLDLRAKRKVIT